MFTIANHMDHTLHIIFRERTHQCVIVVRTTLKWDAGVNVGVGVSVSVGVKS